MPRKSTKVTDETAVNETKPKKPTTKKTVSKKTTTVKKETPDVKPKTTRKRTTKVKEKPIKEVTTEATTVEEVMDNVVTAGDRDCYCYFSLKTTSKKRDADIISIALIDPDGDSLYCENINFDRDKVDKYAYDIICHSKDKERVVHLTGRTWVICSDLKEIKDAIIAWLTEHYTVKEKIVAFVTDMNVLEFALLKDLLTEGKTFRDAELAYAEYCVDLNETLASLYSVRPSDRDKSNLVPINDVEHINRADMCNNLMSIIDKTKDATLLALASWSKGNGNGEDDALFRAYETRVIHQDLWQLRR